MGIKTGEPHGFLNVPASSNVSNASAPYSAVLTTNISPVGYSPYLNVYREHFSSLSLMPMGAIYLGHFFLWGNGQIYRKSQTW